MLRYERLAMQGCGVPILDDVDLEMPARGVAVLLGPSGCGKTTLLRATIRTDEDDPDLACTGRVLLDGQDVRAADYPATRLRQRVGLVMQRPVPFPGTAFENVLFAMKCTTKLTPGEMEARAVEALEHVGLEPQHWTTEAGSLSGGQLKRLAIARSCALHPEVLLMDEPSNGLDPLAVARLEKLIRHLGEDRLVVVVTHDVGMTRRIADRVYFLWPFAGGSRLVEEGTPAEVLDAPRATETRLFVEAAELGAAALQHLGVDLTDRDAEECHPRTLELRPAGAGSPTDSCCDEDTCHDDEVPGPDRRERRTVRGEDPRVEVVHEPRARARRDAARCDRGRRGPQV